MIVKLLYLVMLRSYVASQDRDGFATPQPAPGTECCSRDVFGIVFGCVWAVISFVTLLTFLRRTRAEAANRLMPRIHLGNSRAETRAEARALGLKTRRRRFKVVSRESWEGEDGATKRGMGWQHANMEAAASAMDLLQADITPGPGGVVIAELQDGWLKVVEGKAQAGEADKSIQMSVEPFTDSLSDATVIGNSDGMAGLSSEACNGQSADTSVNASDAVQVVEVGSTMSVGAGKLLIMLPERVKYGRGVSGEVRIDAYGDVIPWRYSKATSLFESKVISLHEGLKARRWVRHKNRWLLEPRSERKGTCLTVDRANLFESSLQAINSLDASQLARPFRIEFQDEDGSDLGGVRREWFQLMALELVKPSLGLFEAAADGAYQISSCIEPCRQSLGLGSATLVAEGEISKDIPVPALEVGAVSEIAIDLTAEADDIRQVAERGSGAQGVITSEELEKVVSLLHFAGKFLAKCVIDQQELNADDLATADPEMYQSLRWILNTNADHEMLGMTMSVDAVDRNGIHVEIDLVEGGRSIPVTEENKADFVNRMVRWRLVDRVAVQTDALVAGFHSVIPLELIENFSYKELELLLHGGESVDLDDWRHNTLYKAGYGPDSNVVVWFWEMLDSMNENQRLRVLKFATGTGAIPPGGFAHLRGPSEGLRLFTIVRVSDPTRLPQAHTCFNELLIPDYTSREEFDERFTPPIPHGTEHIV